MNKKLFLVVLAITQAKCHNFSRQAIECELAAHEALLDLKAAKERAENLRKMPKKVLSLAQRTMSTLDFSKLEKDSASPAKNYALKYFSGVKKKVVKICKRIDSNEKRLNKAIENTSKFIHDLFEADEKTNLAETYSKGLDICKTAHRICALQNRPVGMLSDLEFGLLTFDPLKVAKKITERKRLSSTPKPPARRVLNFAQNKTQNKLTLKTPLKSPVKKLASLDKISKKALSGNLEKNTVAQNVSLLAELEKEINLLGKSINRLSSQIGFDLDSLEKFGQKIANF